MLTRLHRLTTAMLPLTILWIVAPAVIAQQASSKPRLSAEVLKALETGGVDAANKRFEAIFPSRQAEFDLDYQQLLTEATTRMTAGDLVTGQMFLQMYTAVVTRGLDLPSPASEASTPKPAREVPAPAPVELGPKRTDLARFAGFYGVDPVSRASAFAKACEGHLQFGGLWGDAAPWMMRSEAVTTFVQAFVPETQSFPAVRIQFQVDADGRAVAVTLTILDEPATVRRTSDLPASEPKRCSNAGDQ